MASIIYTASTTHITCLKHIDFINIIAGLISVPSYHSHHEHTLTQKTANIFKLKLSENNSMHGPRQKC